MNNMDEYLRRNLIVAQAYGVRSGVMTVLQRLHGTKGWPKWLAKSLKEILEREAGVPEELARWRDEAQHPTVEKMDKDNFCEACYLAWLKNRE